MVEPTVCSGEEEQEDDDEEEEEEEEEESTTFETNSCSVEPRRLARCPEAPESPKVPQTNANSNYHRHSKLSSNVTRVIVEESPDRETSRDSTTNVATTAFAGRFSLFKWFKRGASSSWDRRVTVKASSDRKYVREDNAIASELSSNESVETLYSTATVRSFAFKSGSGATEEDSSRHFASPRSRHFANNADPSVGPFGIGAAKLNPVKSNPNNRNFNDVTRTLPANVLSKRKRDITARYSLQSCNGENGAFGSCDNFDTRENVFAFEGRNACVQRAKVIGVHVRGKRRAPRPPIDTINVRKNNVETTNSPRIKTRGKRRQAPKPPEGAPAKLRGSGDFSYQEGKESSNVREESRIFTKNEQTGSAITSKKEETGSPVVLEKKESGSATDPANEETGSAIASIKEEAGSTALLAQKETGSASSPFENERTGSASVSSKKETGSAISSTKEETGSAPAKQETGSASVSTKKTSGSGNSPLASRETGSAISSIKEETGSAISSTKEETGSASSLTKKKSGSAGATIKKGTGSAVSSIKRETGSAIFLTKTETGSATAPANEETGSAISSIRKESGSAIFLAKKETGSATAPANEETGSAISSTKEGTGSASSLTKKESGSAGVTTKKRTGSAVSSIKRETGSAIFLTKTETGSATAPANRETGSTISSIKKESGSAIFLAKKETGRSTVPSNKETGSAIASIKKESGSAIFLAKKEAGSSTVPSNKETGSAIASTKKESASAIFLAKKEAGSATVPLNKETGSAISSIKEESGSAIFLAKKETGCATVPANKETGSARVSTRKEATRGNTWACEETGSASSSLKKEIADATVPIRKENVSESFDKRQNGSVQREEIVTSDTRNKESLVSSEGQELESPAARSLSEKTQTGSNVTRKSEKSAKGLNFVEVLEKSARAIEKVACFEEVDSSEITVKNIARSQAEESKGSKSSSTGKNLCHIGSKCNESIVEQLKTSNFTFPRCNEDTKNLLESVKSSEYVEAKPEVPDLAGTISNDSLVLKGGHLHSRREKDVALTLGTTRDIEINVSRSKGRITVKTGSQTSSSAMPRPWYKRSVFEHSSRETGTSRRGGDVLRNPLQPEARDDRFCQSTITTTKCPSNEKNHDAGSIGRLNFFHKHDRASDLKKKEIKRKSGISLLVNISELDKEAAAIVQEEQARTRAASVLTTIPKIKDDNFTKENEDIVQEIVNSSMEASPKRGTRALISKFNAIGNITKVTVNTSFFAKNLQSRNEKKIEKIDATTNPTLNENIEKLEFPKTGDSPSPEKDLSRYFLPIQRNTRKKDETSTSSIETNSVRKCGNDLAARLSFFQSISSDEKKNDDLKIHENSIETKISRSNEEIIAKCNVDCSPKFSRLRVNVTNGESTESTKRSIDEKSKKIDNVQKEFTNIFRKIDEKLSAQSCETSTKKIMKAECSSQVSRVLDILVEAEKNDRQRANIGRSKIDTPLAESSLKSDANSRIASRSQPHENSMKTDLREMLKEMKHSLPKRPKGKKPRDEEISTTNAENTCEEELKKEFFSMNDKKKEFFLSDNDKLSILNRAIVTDPPMIMIGPSSKDEAAKKVSRFNEERDNERQKVSSAAQTSGNLRKITNHRLNLTAKWRNDDVIYRTSGKGVAAPGTSGLTKNTFQLMRPREFAQIEAIKTMKNHRVHENTYANVMEPSMYANALVRPKNKMESEMEVSGETESRRHSTEAKKLLRDRDREIIDMEVMAADSKVEEQQNMNTLAVNRLLRKLEAAIASGHHQQAAGLAKELARLKIHCSVVRQRTKAKDTVNVNMYIEDKLAHQGPIPLRLTRSMTVAQLKAKVFTEFEIPIHVQRWIVGKDLADDDTTKLEDFQTVEGSPVFLYLVAPELKADDTQLQSEKEALDETPKDPVLEQINEIPEVSNVDELTEPPVECQTINEEDDEECITEEVRMERYEALISLENCDVIPNSEPIECPICFVTYGPQEGVILRDCLHMFCRPCIANTIRYCEEAEVKCPYRDTEYTCESTLQEREIKALVEPEVYQQHLAKSIAQAENNAGNNAFHCKTPDCPGWCIYDENVNNFLCPVCSANNCLTCQVVHTGKNCRQYQEELRLSKETDQESKRTAAMLEEMVDRGEALSCPTCAVVLMKKWGCDWLRCSMCKTEICWVTRGPRWGPGGKGDTSGGCRCGEKGIKCHPRCNYCH